jgi:hypothetical protein
MVTRRSYRVSRCSIRCDFKPPGDLFTQGMAEFERHGSKITLGLYIEPLIVRTDIPIHDQAVRVPNESEWQLGR